MKLRLILGWSSVVGFVILLQGILPGCETPKSQAPPSCTDGIQDGDETDKDCGGPCAAMGFRCMPGQKCMVDADCMRSCEDAVATASACSDGVCAPVTSTPCPFHLLCAGPAASTCLSLCKTTAECVPPNECHVGKCTLSNGHACDTAMDCSSGTCFVADGGTLGSCLEAVQGSCETSSDCVPGAVCTKGVCLLSDGSICSDSDSCASGSCLAVAAGSPTRCGVTTGEPCTTTADCFSGTCVVPEGATSGTCLQQDGDTCTVGTACASQTCVAGICCATACMPCYVCTSDGSACMPAPASTSCGAATCALVGGAYAQTTEAECDGNGLCLPGTTSSCGPYTCSSVACATSCVGQGSCAANATCLAGACLLDDGQPCGGDAQCYTGHCANGVCCQTACAGTCQACDVVGHVGACTSLPQGATGSGCAAPSACDGLGHCLEGAGQPCTMPGQCASGQCADAGPSGVCI